MTVVTGHTIIYRLLIGKICVYKLSSLQFYNHGSITLSNGYNIVVSMVPLEFAFKFEVIELYDPV